MSILAAVLVAGMAGAQEPPAPEGPRPDRGTEFWVNLLRDRLKLSEDQAAKVREILAKDAEERARADEARNAKIAEVLNEDQKKQFEEMRRNPLGNVGRWLQGLVRPGGPGGGGGGGGPGWGAGAGRFGQVRVEDLQRELDLTEEQVGKIGPIVDEFNERARRRWEELRDSGFRNFNWQEELQRIQDLVKEAGEKLKVHLTESQKEKYDQLVETRMQWVRMAQGFAGVLRPGGGGPPPGGPPPRMNPEERASRVMEALRIEKEEDRRAVADLVSRIARLQAELEELQRTARQKLEAMSRNRELSDEAIEDALRELRRERRQKEKDLAGLQKELSEVVNHRQELELMLHGILK